jgi:phosphatidylserine synthase
VCFIIAPWMLVRGLLAGRGGMLQEALLLLPLVTGAVRYARNGMRLVALDADAGPLPGLGTVFFAFICVDAIFLDARTIVGAVWHDRLLTAFVVFFSVMMVVPVRYPKLTHFRGALPVVLVLLALMPFAGTRVLGVVMLVVGLLFAAFAPLAVHDRPHAPGDRLRRQPELRP